jgi:hypothetical protein
MFEDFKEKVRKLQNKHHSEIHSKPLFTVGILTNHKKKRNPTMNMEEKRISDFKVRMSKVKNTLEELRNEFRYLQEPTLNEFALKSDCLDPSFMVG